MRRYGFSLTRIFQYNEIIVDVKVRVSKNTYHRIFYAECALIKVKDTLCKKAFAVILPNDLHVLDTKLIL